MALYAPPQRSAHDLEDTGGAVMIQSLQERLQQLEERSLFQEAVVRQRSAKLLVAGSVSGFLGFFFALVIGIITEQTSGKVDLNRRPFNSKRGYFPATVSEMVHDPTKPEGKVFFAFCFIGATFIFFSWYPTQLRNAYIGDDELACFGLSWISIRQFIPASGMMLLSIVTVVPGAQAGITDEICIGLHLLGACMLFVGYFIVEAHCVGWGFFKSYVGHQVHESDSALRQRAFCLTMIAVFYTIFIVLQVVLSIGKPFINPEDADKWGEMEGHPGIQLVDTAHWRVKLLKISSYGSEVICGIFLILSHLVIWYHCEERHYDLPEELDSLCSKLVSDPERQRKLAAEEEEYGEDSEDEFD
mmetsp:Transcript_66670/g.168936  ORF Transcript_66670/g.168936 Transcript_66670/m.168936 type:complete len:358 (+) Transcript_66670:69-1142(+)